MIVDCHTHLNCLSVEPDSFDPDDTVKNVDACIVLACHDGDSDSGEVNRQVSEHISRNQGKMVGFATVDPVNDKVGQKQIARLKDDSGLKGIVLYCTDRGFHPAHSRAMCVYKAAAELGMPVFFHNSGPMGHGAVMDYSQPYLIDEIARCFPGLKIIIGGMGRPFVEQTICMLNKHENVYADLSIAPEKVWQIYNVVLAAHEADVMDRLLFGSGFPLRRAEACIEVLLGFNRLLADTNLPTVPREKIRSIIERDSLEVLGIEL